MSESASSSSRSLEDDEEEEEEELELELEPAPTSLLQLPPELLLDIFGRLPLLDRLKLACSCRYLFDLMMAEVLKYNVMTLSSWDGYHCKVTFPNLKGGTSPPKRLKNPSEESIHCDSLYGDLSNFECFAVLTCALSAKYLPYLRDLRVDFAETFKDSDALDGLYFDFPGLVKIAVEGIPPNAVAAIIRGSPGLKDLEWRCLTSEEVDPSSVAKVPDDFLQKLTYVTSFSNALLEHLLKRDSFAPPRMVYTEDYWAFGPPIPPKNTVEIWRRLMEMDNLKHAILCDFSSECLLLGTPLNATVAMDNLIISGMDETSLVRLREALNDDVNYGLNVLVNEDWSTRGSAAERSNYARELLFWLSFEDTPQVSVVLRDADYHELDKNNLRTEALSVLEMIVE